MKIGIVNDSVMAMEVLRRIVSSNDQHEIIWRAVNGAEAVSYCNQEKPDLVLMDIMMPVMNGIEATRQIMQSSPCAILVVTATVTGHSSEVFEAMGAGALDAVATPVLSTEGSEDLGKELLRKIDLIGRLIGIPAKKVPKKTDRTDDSLTGKTQERHLIILGCSTGGPQALLEILSTFPVDLNAAVIVIQHMDKKFTAGLASWLNKQVALPVRIIKEGDRPQKGIVLMPDTDHHLVMTASTNLSYSKAPEDNFYHPSVDVFFNSAAQAWYGKIVGVLLTGMGKDGAEGLLAIKERGWHTIAQNQESCIVFGMPKAAIQIHAATEILPLKDIGPRIIELIPTH